MILYNDGLKYEGNFKDRKFEGRVKVTDLNNGAYFLKELDKNVNVVSKGPNGLLIVDDLTKKDSKVEKIPDADKYFKDQVTDIIFSKDILSQIEEVLRSEYKELKRYDKS